jgi:hypothetical protein
MLQQCLSRDSMLDVRLKAFMSYLCEEIERKGVQARRFKVITLVSRATQYAANP